MNAQSADPHRSRPDRRSIPAAAVALGLLTSLGLSVVTAPPAAAASEFASSFEPDQAPPMESVGHAEETKNVTGAEPPTVAPMRTVVGSGPAESFTATTGVGWTGVRALQYVGVHLEDGEAQATNELFDVDVRIGNDQQLTYKVFPVLDDALTYDATHVAVDLLFTDGSRLSATGSTDSAGYAADARSQGEADVLWPDQWNSVRVDLSAVEGRTVDKVLLSYSNAEVEAESTFEGWVDDITVEPIATTDVSDGLVSYVDTRRGTNSSGDFSRGNNLPATAWPNGFNFLTPMTDANTAGTVYSYQGRNNEQNLPELQGIGISHQPSIWMGDRNQLAVLPSASQSPVSTLDERALAFSHANEVARPDLYSVAFENGQTVAATPTDHGVVYRFGLDGGGSVLIDQGYLDTKNPEPQSGLTVDADGVVSGWVESGSYYPGRSRMFVHGRFDQRPTAAGATERGDRRSAQFAAFATDQVELRLATSFISIDQAAHNYALEVEGRSFEQVQTAVKDAWNERLAVISDIEGASDDQLVNVYSNLYRLNLYPNSQFENTGTVENPVYKYASPVTPLEGPERHGASDSETNAEVRDGKLYVNNGFWDTYRTAWPLYALLYPDLTTELVDGFVQQYRDGGWVARWSSPGYADLMTGTSSDASFAEAYLAGAMDTDLALEAYDAAVKNATVLPESNAVGRKGLDSSIFLGYTQSETDQSASWGLEGFINDFGIAEMAAALAEDPGTPDDRRDRLREEADYFADRSEHFVEMYNPDQGVFTARNADGSWPEEFDKREWGGAFTEASAWTFAFHAPHDVDGLAALYGGRRELVDELHEFLATPERAEHSGIHEAREARDVRLGMLGMSNQVAHHIPYVLAEAGDPAGSQELIREIQQRLFVGGDIGQGYPGDEDNGEMSAWYLFSAMGFYPLQVGSGDYTLGSPLFDSITINPDGGESLTINSSGAADGQVYVSGVSHNGAALGDVTVDGDLIRDGGTLDFTMSPEPGDFGAKDLDQDLDVPAARIDITDPEFGELQSEQAPVEALVDDNMRSAVDLDETADLTWTSTSGPVVVDRYTLTAVAADSAPGEWTLSGSIDGQNWTELDSRKDQAFAFGTQTRPFTIPESTGRTTAWNHLRLSVDGPGRTALAEIEIFGDGADVDELILTAAGDQRVQVGEEFDDRLATVVRDGADADDFTATVDYGDGQGARAAAVEPNGIGGWTISAPVSFDEPAWYAPVITVTDKTGASAQTRAKLEVWRDDTFAAALNNVCIGDLNETGASCDGQGYGYDRAQLADHGFIQGRTHAVPGTDLSFDLPAVDPGEPDNLTTDGRTFAVDLGEGATRFGLIATATESDKQLSGTLNFADGSSQEIPIEFGDWVGAASDPKFDNQGIATSTRLDGTQAESDARTAGVFASEPVDIDTADGAAKEVVSVTLPAEEGSLRSAGRVHIFAFASDGRREPLDELVIEAEDVGKQTAGEQFEADLAVVSGFPDPERLRARINWGDGSDVSTASVDADGIVSGEHTYAQAGDHEVLVVVDDGFRSASTSLTLTVQEAVDFDPVIAVDPKTAEPGQQVIVTGEGFAPGEQVSVVLAGTDPVSATAEENGSTTVTLQVPSDAPDGTYPITAVGVQSKTEAGTELQVRAATLDPVPTGVELVADTERPLVGEPFTLTASVDPSEARGTVQFRAGDQVVGTSQTTDGRASVRVRSDSVGEQHYTARFVPTEPDRFAESTSEPLVLTVGAAAAEPQVILSADRIAPGDDLGIRVRGFAPGEPLRLELHSDVLLLGEAATDETGAASESVVVPREAAPGRHTVIVIGEQSGSRAGAPLEIIGGSGTDDPGSGGPGSGDGDSDDGGSGANGLGSEEPHRPLADTGAPTVILAAISGTVALVIGSTVLLRRRRHR